MHQCFLLRCLIVLRVMNFCCAADCFKEEGGTTDPGAILPEEIVYLTESHIALGFVRQALPFEPAGGNLIVTDDQDIFGGQSVSPSQLTLQ